MNHIKIKYVNRTSGAEAFVQRLISKLDVNKHQVSTESQQLHSVGIMPDPSYEVLDLTKMSIAQAIRVYQDAKDHLGKQSKYVILKDENSETIQQRIDREAMEKGLKDLGAEVFSSETDVADDIQTKYNDLSLTVSEG